MPTSTDAKIRQLFGQAMAAKDDAEVKRVEKELRAAITEHARVAKAVSGGQGLHDRGTRWGQRLGRDCRSENQEGKPGVLWRRPLRESMPKKPNVTLPGTVERVITPPDPREPEKAQINIQHGADPLYKEIRIENVLTDQHGKEVKLKKGATVEVTVEANPSGIIPKQE